MILIDTNVFVYAAGCDSRWKKPCATLLRRLAGREVEAVVDVGVLQEILHYYWCENRIAEGFRVYDRARCAAREVLPMTLDVMNGARAILEEYPAMKTMDAVHASVCALNGIPVICSYDRHFNNVRGLRRVRPQDVP